MTQESKRKYKIQQMRKKQKDDYLKDNFQIYSIFLYQGNKLNLFLKIKQMNQKTLFLYLKVSKILKKKVLILFEYSVQHLQRHKVLGEQIMNVPKKETKKVDSLYKGININIIEEFRQHFRAHLMGLGLGLGYGSFFFNIFFYVQSCPKDLVVEGNCLIHSIMFSNLCFKLHQII
ncbi:unnamed protein product [Paramecium octaurelia]|uniref:Transmembrane protein n=1 Tax=Paramecium octaurelia TaxID=43137 RepID=A0A8S1XAY0_PAROT|nr:unnamed protein product [Paramecium octaurelia]